VQWCEKKNGVAKGKREPVDIVLDGSQCGQSVCPYRVPKLNHSPWPKAQRQCATHKKKNEGEKILHGERRIHFMKRECF